MGYLLPAVGRVGPSRLPRPSMVEAEPHRPGGRRASRIGLVLPSLGASLQRRPSLGTSALRQRRPSLSESLQEALGAAVHNVRAWPSPASSSVWRGRLIEMLPSDHRCLSCQALALSRSAPKPCQRNQDDGLVGALPVAPCERPGRGATRRKSLLQRLSMAPSDSKIPAVARPGVGAVPGHAAHGGGFLPPNPMRVAPHPARAGAGAGCDNSLRSNAQQQLTSRNQEYDAFAYAIAQHEAHEATGSRRLPGQCGPPSPSR